MHSFTLNQYSQEEKTIFEEQLIKSSLVREIWRIGIEWIGTATPELILCHYSNGKLKRTEVLAECHQHGEWINWKGKWE